MELNNLKPASGSTKVKKRLGRGEGSKTGGTAGRGHKGAQSRSGYKAKKGFEGGQKMNCEHALLLHVEQVQERGPKFLIRIHHLILQLQQLLFLSWLFQPPFSIIGNAYILNIIFLYQ